MAAAATTPITDRSRNARSLIEADSWLPALADGLRIHWFLLPAFVSYEHENRPDSLVGRLHYSLSPTLSAHFRWGVRASESYLCFLVREYWEGGRTIGIPE